MVGRLVVMGDIDRQRHVRFIHSSDMSAGFTQFFAAFHGLPRDMRTLRLQTILALSPTLPGYGRARLAHVRSCEAQMSGPNRAVKAGGCCHGKADQGPACSMVIKSHRILALVLLCVGLLVAGTPAMACGAQATATHDCCSNRSCPSGGRSDEIAPHCRLQDCCAAGAPTAVALVSDITSNKTDIQPTRADPPLPITFLPALSTISSSARSGVAAAAPPIFTALSPLYLSTRRLRL
jgi:hypothetical protein